MKIPLNSPKRRQRGYTLVLVVAFAAVSVLALASVMDWGIANTRLNHRSNQYQTTLAAAEAATEKALAGMERDFQLQGENLVFGNLSTYRNSVPGESESPWWSGFVFSDGQGLLRRTYVNRVAAESSVPVALESQYQGIFGFASRYRVVSNARMLNTPHDLTAGVRQDIQLATIPVFQFAIFYNMDLEINPGPNMNITGRVHGNADIYTQPVNTLRFLKDVTAVGAIIPDKHPEDPSIRSVGKVIFNGQHDGGVAALTLPVGTNNSAEAVHAVIEVPPSTEDPNSIMGRQRYYNKSDLVILVSNSTVTVRTGTNYRDMWGNTVAVPTNQWTNFVTFRSFYNKREGATVQTTDIDVGKLKTWTSTNTVLRTILGHSNVNSVYVADFRTLGFGEQAGVRVKNGQILPDDGLTVSTPHPLYVQGHFNAPNAALGTTNTSQTKPASLVGDAITVLSTDWNDANSGMALSSRVAGNTTVNAAFLSGIVPSGGGYYSGGVENFPRFLETWSGKTLTYNGSMVVMFGSQTATAPWGMGDVYSPPARNWAFDVNFLDSAKLPPGTPMVRALIRGQWAAIRAGTVN
jgi:hypothetical protein